MNLNDLDPFSVLFGTIYGIVISAILDRLFRYLRNIKKLDGE